MYICTTNKNIMAQKRYNISINKDIMTTFIDLNKSKKAKHSNTLEVLIDKWNKDNG